MAQETGQALTPSTKDMSAFERYLTLWVGLCIMGGILLGKVAPDLATALDGMALYVNGAPVVSIPIAICLFFMMYPIMVKIDFAEVVTASRNTKTGPAHLGGQLGHKTIYYVRHCSGVFGHALLRVYRA